MWRCRFDSTRNSPISVWCVNGLCSSRMLCGMVFSVMSAETSERLAGRLFGPSTSNDHWDARCLFHPIVVKDPHSLVSPWRMYYYGRDRDSWHSGVSRALISTGRIGMATSEDGLKWEKFQGALPGGALMDPKEGNMDAFDSVHVGCSDVLFHDDQWLMFYFGGSLEEVSLTHGGGSKMRGLRMRPGLAFSLDGISFERSSETPLLEVGAEGDWDELIVGWPRVIPPSPPSQRGNWVMTYNSGPPSSCIGLATSADGKSWHKVVGKPVLERGSRGSWDEAGVGRRHALKLEHGYVMFYEGVDSRGVHGIGLAVSGDGLEWHKAEDCGGGGGGPGGPIFTARTGSDAWDSGGVAAPHVVRLDDKSFRLYYTGFDSTKRQSAMGIAASDGENYRCFARVQFAE